MSVGVEGLGASRRGGSNDGERCEDVRGMGGGDQPVAEVVSDVADGLLFTPATGQGTGVVTNRGAEPLSPDSADKDVVRDEEEEVDSYNYDPKREGARRAAIQAAWEAELAEESWESRQQRERDERWATERKEMEEYRNGIESSLLVAETEETQIEETKMVVQERSDESLRRVLRAGELRARQGNYLLFREKQRSGLFSRLGAMCQWIANAIRGIFSCFMCQKRGTE
ncbi:MAG: hypothetical protein OXF02_06985 [Simkaniaceae bacterium]|nr:hypothetical protein [Simkaniaceae bacterium]